MLVQCMIPYARAHVSSRELVAAGNAPALIMQGYFESGKVRPHIYQSIPLGNASAAFALSKTGHVVGKVAVVVDPM